MNDQEYYLAHHGVKGMKWGVRRYQNADGTLTDAGKKRQQKQISKKLNAAWKLEQKTEGTIGRGNAALESSKGYRLLANDSKAKGNTYEHDYNLHMSKRKMQEYEYYDKQAAKLISKFETMKASLLKDAARMDRGKALAEEFKNSVIINQEYIDEAEFVYSIGDPGYERNRVHLNKLLDRS